MLLDLTQTNLKKFTAENHNLRGQIKWSLWYLGLLGIAGFVALFMVRGTPSFSAVAWLLLFVGVALIIYQPRYGIYITLFWALAGDSDMMFWYPFFKNFSSRETLLFLNDAAIISPLELYLVLTLLSWFLRDALNRKFHLYRGPLFWPALVFTAFIGFGLFYGISRGGNVNIALWESRSIFYLPLFMILVSNLLLKRKHIENAIWAVMLALLVEGLYGSYMMIFELRFDLSTLNSLTQHPAAIHLGTILVLAITTWMYKVSWRLRLFLLLIIPPAIITFIGGQRRAAYIAVILAIVLLVIVLYRERKTAFMIIAPPLAILGLLYIGFFWNSNHALGLGAQAVKSVIAEDQASHRDQASNLYRDIENLNSTFTIKQEPITGVGFGNRYYIVWPLPDISIFPWWDYIPHNSIIYIWIKSGIGGFLSMLTLFGLTIMHGIRAFIRVNDGSLKAITLTTTIYIVMHLVFAYVDLSWEPQSMLYVGLAMGIINCVERVATIDPPVTKPRRPWQPKMSQPASLLPLN